MFKINPLYLSDGYKVGHKKMLAPKTKRLYGTAIPRSLKYAPKGIKKIMSFGHQMTWRYIDDIFNEFFFNVSWKEASQFGKDMTLYLNTPYNDDHFRALHDLGYLPIKVKALPEGIETLPNIPHETFINTVDDFAWLVLYLETIISNLSWKPMLSATLALQFHRNARKWVNKTDAKRDFLIPYLCHDFSARGLNPHDMISSGLGHATSFRGSDTLAVIPAARYYYNEPIDTVAIESVNASEHSVSTTKIFTVGEQQMIADWLQEFPEGILSIVSDTFDLWKLITEYLPANKEAIMARNGKLVIRPDSGDPVDIICGLQPEDYVMVKGVPYKTFDVTELETIPPQFIIKPNAKPCYNEIKGVVELLWDIFGGEVNEQEFKILDSHIGAIYGDSINLERQIAIYERLAEKGFACTNVVLGIGSFTYQWNTRDTLGYAIKGAWFEVENDDKTRTEYAIYKDPITDDGSKKSLKGLQQVYMDETGEYQVKSECTWDKEQGGVLQVIYKDGKFYEKTSLSEIRDKVNELSEKYD